MYHNMDARLKCPAKARSTLVSERMLMLNSALTLWCYFYNATNMGFVEGGKCPSWHKTVHCISAYFSVWTQKYLVHSLVYNLEHTLCFSRHLPSYGHCWWQYCENKKTGQCFRARQVELAARVVWCIKFNNPAFKTHEMLLLSYNFTFKMKRLRCWIKQREPKANRNQKVTERCVSDIVQWQQRAEEQLQLFTGWFHHSCSELRLSLSPSLPLRSCVFQYPRTPNWYSLPYPLISSLS